MFHHSSQRSLRRAVSRGLVYRCSRCRRSIGGGGSPTQTRHVATTRRVVFSGIQPTGVPHLGNYLGALRQWVKLQDSASPSYDERYFSIVDLHAVTTRQDPRQLKQWRKEMFASLLAIGLDPKKSCIFAQGDVRQHTELMWLLSCNASMGYLGRMTQWKSKLALPNNASPLDPSPSNKAALKLGLFSYPVLQAADVLLYDTTHVPVGEDQAQHLEFTRDVAIGFNSLYKDDAGEPLFAVPDTILSPAKRVMSLTSPSKKMSKSDADVKSRILITDSKEVVVRKIKGAVTDSIEGITYDRDARPGVSNLIDILYHLDESVAASPAQLVESMFAGSTSMKALKEKVADAIDDELSEVRERYSEIMAKSDVELFALAREGADVAERRAQVTMERVKVAVGLSW